MKMKTRVLSIDVEYDYETEQSESIKILPRMLDYFAQKNITATFFVLGKIAEQYPSVVKELSRQHEVATHCYEHLALSALSDDEQEKQMRKGKEAIEKLGIACRGIRAPYFMVGKRHLELIKKVGFEYDSSTSTFFPWRYHHFSSATKPSLQQGIVEFPVPNWLPFFPPAGLSYYRLFYPVSRVFSLPYLLYLHPCEFLASPMTRRLPSFIRKAYARHQGEDAWNIFTQLIDNSSCKWVSCRQYLDAAGHDKREKKINVALM